MHKWLDQPYLWLFGLFLAALSLNGHAGSVNVHVYGPVPLTGTANDFHVQVTITEPFVLGAPIDFHNGPFATDGVFSASSTGFSVDWSGAEVTGGGPYDFQFDFTVNQPFTGVAYWTLNGNRVQNVPPGALTFETTEIPEPSSLGLLALAAALLLAQRVRPAGTGARFASLRCPSRA